MMNPDDDKTVAVRRLVRKGWRRFIPIRCSICTLYIWLHPITLKEPTEAPEPRREWIICSYCFKALLDQIHRAALTTPVRLRVAIGLLAAERSPGYTSEHPDFDREFSWFVWAMVLFALFHLVLFVILFAIPR